MDTPPAAGQPPAATTTQPIQTQQVVTPPPPPQPVQQVTPVAPAATTTPPSPPIPPAPKPTPTPAVPTTQTPAAVSTQPAPKIPPVVPHTQRPTATPDQEAQIVAELLVSYKRFLSTPNATPVSFKNAAKTFSNITQRLLKSPTPAVLLEVWNFFVANKSGILQESCALQGVDSLDVQSRFRMELVYTLFRMAVNGVDVGDPTKVSATVIQTRLKCSALIVFLQDQAKVVAAVAAAAQR